MSGAATTTIYAQIHSYTNGAGAQVQTIAAQIAQPMLADGVTPDPAWTAYTVATQPNGLPDPDCLSIVNGAIVASTTVPAVELTNAELAAQAYAAAIAQGIVITSTSEAALNGTYGVSADPDPFGNTDQSNIAAEQQYISDFGTFTDGSTTQFLWAQKDGAWVAFMSTAQFTAFAKFSAEYVSGCKVAAGLQAAGQTPTWPTNTVTIP